MLVRTQNRDSTKTSNKIYQKRGTTLSRKSTSRQAKSMTYTASSRANCRRRVKPAREESLIIHQKGGGLQYAAMTNRLSSNGSSERQQFPTYMDSYGRFKLYVDDFLCATGPSTTVRRRMDASACDLSRGGLSPKSPRSGAGRLGENLLLSFPEINPDILMMEATEMQVGYDAPSILRVHSLRWKCLVFRRMLGKHDRSCGPRLQCCPSFGGRRGRLSCSARNRWCLSPGTLCRAA
jgi:hypothetical protein